MHTQLLERLAALFHEDGELEPIPGVHVYRMTTPAQKIFGVFEPSLCVIAQGSKEVRLGDERYRYDPDHYLLASVNVPVASQVLEVPYLSFRLSLDAALVSEVMLEAQAEPVAEVRGLNVSPLEPELLDACERLLRLVGQPDEIRVLAPLIKREIVFRLLRGEQGARLRHIAIVGGHSHRIARAMEQLRTHLDQPLRLEEMAHELGMSLSAFHLHFKAVTSLSPLQFLKQLRLQEARRLMLGENLDAASAGFKVGYLDASHFSRDYKRMFGEPPARDVGRLREAVGA